MMGHMITDAPMGTARITAHANKMHMAPDHTDDDYTHWYTGEGRN